jgi:hypothetical protein
LSGLVRVVVDVRAARLDPELPSLRAACSGNFNLHLPSLRRDQAGRGDINAAHGVASRRFRVTMNRSTPLLRPALELQYWATRTASRSPVATNENRLSVRTDLQ